MCILFHFRIIIMWMELFFDKFIVSFTFFLSKLVSIQTLLKTIIYICFSGICNNVSIFIYVEIYI